MPKLKISPSQALLLLITKHENNPAQLEQLKQWYLSGFEPRFDAVGKAHLNLPEAFQNMLLDPLFKNYNISFDANVINNDPSRRYFETHLAYHTLENNLDNLDETKLNAHKRNLLNIIPVIAKTAPQSARRAIGALEGDLTDKKSNFFNEYARYIHKINNNNGPFKAFSAKQREKIKTIASASMLGVLNAEYNDLPIDIYDKGFYTQEQKGRVVHEAARSVRNSHLGVMKSYMPLSRDDLAATEDTPDFLKPSDQAGYIDHAHWVQYNFAKAVHPFSNAISGTMLAQIRNIERYQEDNPETGFCYDSEELKKYSQLFISTMLFGSGGHTLHEYTTPLTLPEVTHGLTGNITTPLSIESVFKDNNPGFEIALKETLQYNEQLLSKQRMHQELKKEVKHKSSEVTKIMRAATTIFKDAAKAIRHAIEVTPVDEKTTKNIDKENKGNENTKHSPPSHKL